MGEPDPVHRRPGTLRLVAVALAVTGVGCSSGGGRGSVAPGVPSTEAPISAAPIKSLGPRLPTGPPAPPTTSSLNRPTTTGGRAPGVGVSATHDPATPDCPAVDLSVSAATDRASYPDATPVAITVSILNSGAAVCQFQPNAVNGGAQIQQSGGRPVWEPRRGTAAPAASFYRLAPRQPTVVLTLTWDQHSCAPPCTGVEGSRVNTGSYRAQPQISGVATVHPASFAVT